MPRILITIFLILNFNFINEIRSDEYLDLNFRKILDKNINSNDFACFQLSRKYIPGQKFFSVNIGNLKFNFINFTGYRKVNKYKCLLTK